MKITLTHSVVIKLVNLMASRIINDIPSKFGSRPLKIYAIPRGGIPVAYSILRYISACLVEDPAEADIFIDDIIDSGKTMLKFCDRFPGRPFFALIDKTEEDCPYKDSWIVFPWEKETEEMGPAENVRRLIQFAGDDPNREGLHDTPKRVLEAFGHWFSGYSANIPELLKVFEDGAEKYDQMVIVKDIPIYSTCEHHMADIFGTATIAYVPNGKIVGLSKLSRVANAYARRLQVQERLTNQIADAIDENLKPKGVAVLIKARHMCMESRGICQQGHHTITSALRGILKTDQAARAEFMQLAN